MKAPAVVVRNQSGVEVDVTLWWGKRKKVIGAIPPWGRRYLTISTPFTALDVIYPCGRRKTISTPYLETAMTVTIVIPSIMIDVENNAFTDGSWLPLYESSE